MTAKTRVMLVDDHALCRSGLTELLEHRGDLRHAAVVAFEERHDGYSFLGLMMRLASANRP